MIRSALIFALLIVWFVTVSTGQTSERTNLDPNNFSPVADHHQHLFSPIVTELAPGVKALTAQDLIQLLDTAGIKRAVVLSIAYQYGRPGREPEDEYAKVKAENDWTGEEAAKYPKRLRAFCAFNPLKQYALEELARCSKNPNLRHGIKLHFGNSDVQLENPEHLEKMRGVFRAANSARMAIVVHLRASISLKRPYGAEQARIFLDELLPLAPDVTVQIAHLAGSGPGFDDPQAQAALEVLAEAASKGGRLTKNLWFDVTTVAVPENSPEVSARLVKRIRQIGLKRVLYGSDAAAGSNLKPREGWDAFSRVGLSKKELKTIGKNVAPYLR